MLNRLFKRRSHGMQQTTGLAPDYAVHASLQELIDLHLQARPLQMTGKRRASRALAGNHESRFKGRGMDYLESREYQAGDDIRNMDWRITARSGKPHIKLFQEERERPVLMLTDFSAGMFFASHGRFKSVIGAQTAALIAWSAIRHGDRIGGVMINHGHHEMSPRPGKKAVLHWLNQLHQHSFFDKTTPHGDADLSQAMQRLSWLARPGSLVFIISDFLQDSHNHNLESRLQKIRRHSDCVLIRISDWLEVNTPPANYYRLTDGRQELILNTRDRVQQAEFLTQFSQRRQQLEQTAKKLAIPLLELTTDVSPVDKLQNFFAGHAIFNQPSSGHRL